jgi:putative flippase GtrA
MLTPGRPARGFFSRGFGGQLLRAVPVSLASFALDFGTLAFLTEAAGLHYLLSAAAAFLLGTTLTWFLSVKWVFSVRLARSRAMEYGLFVFVGVVGLGLNEILLWAFTEKVGLYYLLAKMCASTLVFSWNFGMRRALLFR